MPGDKMWAGCSAAVVRWRGKVYGYEDTERVSYSDGAVSSVVTVACAIARPSMTASRAIPTLDRDRA
jgi:hypothetical protein